MGRRGRVPLSTFGLSWISLRKACVKGDSGWRGGAPGAYALFADVAKACGQVWRDGLYLTLYSMGVRGAMWHIIQERLNNATALAVSMYHLEWGKGPHSCVGGGRRPPAGVPVCT